MHPSELTCIVTAQTEPRANGVRVVSDLVSAQGR
jgi:hypothetical protein